MSDWGSYLKNAVANVEQQLDKVLLEQNKQESVKSKPKLKSNRPDLAERLKHATKGRTPTSSIAPEVRDSYEETTTSENDNEVSIEKEKNEDVSQNLQASNENEVIELLTNTSFEVAPDLSEVILEARKLALAVQRDDALALVDSLEDADAELNNYIDSISSRFAGLHSKVKVLSTQKAEESNDTKQRQLALLMEEGQRLSQQELKLGLMVKKLRKERSSAISKAEIATSKLEALETQISNLNAEAKIQTSSVKELEAMVEHFRISAESANKMLDSQLQQSHQNLNDASSQDLNVLAEERFSVEKAKWNIIETDLLARIGDLEQQTDAKSSQIARLNLSLKDAQQVSRDCREQVAELQDKLDNSVEQHTIEESRLEREINELKVLHETMKNESNVLNNRNAELEQKLHSALKNLSSIEYPENDAFAYNHYDEMDPTTMNSTVGPSGPFGEYAYDLNPKCDPENSHYTDPINIPETSFDAMPDAMPAEEASLPSHMGDLSGIESHRESSVIGQESTLGGNLNLVKRLTLKARKLENELLVCQKSCEFAMRERDEFQAELEKMVDTQGELQQSKQEVKEVTSRLEELNSRITNMNTTINDKNERIDELEQDVRDLKDMYKEQVEALVNEIETIRKN